MNTVETVVNICDALRASIYQHNDELTTEKAEELDNIVIDYEYGLTVLAELCGKYKYQSVFDEGTREEKQRVNAITWELSDLERLMRENTPIFDSVLREFKFDYEGALPDFLKDGWEGYEVEQKQLEGWYQNSAGDLFHYDGVVWDVVPESVKDLEFLG